MTRRNCKNTRKGPMTKFGFQACGLGVSYEYYPGDHTCRHFVAVVVASVDTKGKRK